MKPPHPMPVPPGVPVLLYGGVFDPPHRAHIELALAAREWCMPEGWLVYVPAARSPFKGAPRTSDADRVEMLRLALRDAPRTATWTDELDRAEPGEPSYWIDTLRRARAAVGEDAPLRFLIGTDQAAEFHRWRDFREIIRIAEPLVMLRPPIEHANALADALRRAGAWSDAAIDEWLERIAPVPIAQTNATEVRARLARGEAVDDLLDAEVLRYIRERGLYR